MGSPTSGSVKSSSSSSEESDSAMSSLMDDRGMEGETGECTSKA